MHDDMNVKKVVIVMCGMSDRILFKCNLGLRTEPEEISSKDYKYCIVEFFFFLVRFSIRNMNLDG